MTSTAFVTVDGVRTRVLKDGTGDDVVVLVHGGGLDYRASTTADDWAVTLPRLAEEHTVYALDLLGSGETDSPRTDEDHTMSAVIDHAWGTIEALGVRRCALVGHSRGGIIAMSIALDHPEVVAALVLVDSNILADDDPVVPRGFLEPAYTDHPSGSAESLRRIMALNTYRPTPSTDVVLERKIERLRVPHPHRSPTEEAVRRVHELSGRFLGPDQRACVESIRRRLRSEGLDVPCLVVWGLNDRAAPLKVGLDLYQLIAMTTHVAQLHVLNRSGHWPHVERGDDVHDVLGVFLRGVSRRSPNRQDRTTG